MKLAEVEGSFGGKQEFILVLWETEIVLGHKCRIRKMTQVHLDQEMSMVKNDI